MARFGDVFANREYRALLSAYTISMAGDQFARVAVSVLVFDRTRSPALTALTYALTFLPDLLGGPLLAGIADRCPRRTVMITADVLRAVLVVIMAMPGTTFLGLAGLLVVVQLAASPSNAARGALLPQILTDEEYPIGQAGLSSAGQAAQVAGFAGGGALILAIGTSGVLLADAATFAASAALALLGIRHRDAAATSTDLVKRSWGSDLVAGFRLVATTPQLRALIAFACVSGIYIAGEALAAPYAAELGGGPTLVGLLFAGFAAGAVAGMLVLARLSTATRLRALPMLAVGSCLPLVLCAVDPPAAVVVALFVISGFASGYQVTASTTFMQLVPDDRRGQAFGLAVTALKVSQGVGVGLAGLVADWVGPHGTVALAGVIGVAFASGVGLLWRAAGGGSAASTTRPTPAPEPG
ncbi:MFS transporter [Kutzneria buriramensis]|uniref:MFS-type transporter involved in bile tolerance (Atg22 family) n=1 Tax=Kutzneria buriramensis TaxID=1045776 RepID=A0A3E0I5C6_9PSEU|nr:MFS transporter [Kutzneria buriramensis]REH53800.1 MFS-type transporter involved in bile tolerance (Atg22 family) [Kutzneria buriramensis]